MDPVAALVLAEAGALDQPVAVLDDVDGTLTRAAAGTGADVRAWCDDIRQQDLLPPPPGDRPWRRPWPGPGRCCGDCLARCRPSRTTPRRSPPTPRRTSGWSPAAG
ncbi:MAG: hypothetical protein HZY73_04380 [Micropruina sp.]|nr:MAG: hypothetical protein HZY73_04380 [Micropruina sp.]